MNKIHIYELYLSWGPFCVSFLFFKHRVAMTPCFFQNSRNMSATNSMSRTISTTSAIIPPADIIGGSAISPRILNKINVHLH